MATKKETAKETVKDAAYYNEPVTIKLFKDTNKYKDDVFVAVNGVGMIIPRGKEVTVPRKYAIALKNSEAQDSFAAEYSSQLSENAESDALN